MMKVTYDKTVIRPPKKLSFRYLYTSGKGLLVTNHQGLRFSKRFQGKDILMIPLEKWGIEEVRKKNKLSIKKVLKY